MTLKEVVVKVVVSVASLLLVAMRDPDHQALLYGAVLISKVTGDVGKNRRGCCSEFGQLRYTSKRPNK